jgi:RNA polymerase sigma-70 factor (ECF subfamily)
MIDQDMYDTHRARGHTLDTPDAIIGRLYQEYQRPILAHLCRLVGDLESAEDLCQETFVKALRSWAQHDPNASSVGWLYRIATNTAYDYLRRRRRIRFIPLLDAERMFEEPFGDESPPDKDEPVRAALAQLPERYRVPLVLHACEGHSTQEIADALGCTSGAVKTRLFRARERFRRVYQADWLNEAPLPAGEGVLNAAVVGQDAPALVDGFG